MARTTLTTCGRHTRTTTNGRYLPSCYISHVISSKMLHCACRGTYLDFVASHAV
jgi:hypothetical protein